MRFRPEIVACLLLGTALSSSWLTTGVQAINHVSLGGVPWPMFRQDLLHAGRSPYLGAQMFHLKWSFDTGGEIDSTPAIDSDGNVYVQSRSGYVYSLDSNGGLKWKFPTFDSIVGCCFRPESSPAINSNGTLYVGSSDGNLYALFPNGTLEWRYLSAGPVHTSSSVGKDGANHVWSAHNKIYARIS